MIRRPRRPLPTNIVQPRPNRWLLLFATSLLGVCLLIFPPSAQAEVLFFDDFEEGLAKWPVIGSSVISTAHALTGSKSVTLTQVAAGGDARTSVFAVTPGQTYYLHTGYMTLGGGGYIGIDQFNSSMNQIDEVWLIGDGGFPAPGIFDYNVLTQDPSKLGTWNLYSQPYVVPANVAFVRIKIEDWFSGLPNNPPNVFFDNVEWSTDSTPSSGNCSFQITTFSPNKGGNTGDVTVTIRGCGLTSETQARLVDASNVIVNGKSTTVISSTLMRTTFDLHDQAVRGGLFVEVFTSDGTSARSTTPFLIESGTPPHLWVDIVGLSTIRAGREARYWIAYGTSGNIDIPSSTILVSLPRNLTFHVDTPFFGPTPPKDVRGDEERQIIVLNATNLTPGSVEVVPLRVQAPLSGSFQLSSIIRRDFVLSERPLAHPQTAPQSLAPAQGGRITNIVVQFPRKGDRFDSGHIGYLTPDGRVFDLGQTRQDPQDRISQSPYNPNDWDANFTIPNLTADQSQKLYDWAVSKIGPVIYDHGKPKDIDNGRGACDGFIEAGLEFVGYNNGDGLVDNLKETFSFSIADMYDSLQSLTGNSQQPYPKGVFWTNTLIGITGDIGDAFQWLFKNINTVLSIDPNEKVGRDGVGDQRFIQASGPMQYIVMFENLSSATAPAQEVIVTDYLDPNVFDLSQFSLGPISFGQTSIVPASGLSNFSADVDLRPLKDLLVRISADIDHTTGVATWRLTSIDPDTGQLPEDPFSGFLPPNVISPQGEGAVLFSVPLQSGLSSGSVVRNQAQIVFDLNDPIDTPEWLNTVDASHPTSSVLSLASVQQVAEFLVEWAGADIGSGIQDYTIFVSENGGPYVPWQQNVALTSAKFHGLQDHTYSFFSVARDLAGNTESMKTVGEATTTVDVPGRVLSDLKDAKAWVGLQNSDAVGLRLDLQAEVFLDSDLPNNLIGTGHLDNQPAGSSGFNNAQLRTIPLDLTNGPVLLPVGSKLLLKLSARRTCSGPGHASGTPRLWYNGKAIDVGAVRDAGARFTATIDDDEVTFYLRSGSSLSEQPGTSRLPIDKLVNSKEPCPQRKFMSFGTWSWTVTAED